MKLLATILLSFSLLGACNMGVNQELNNMTYDEVRQMIRIGMTKDQVREIMGKPLRESVVNGQATWAYGAVSIGLNAFNPYTARSGISNRTLVVSFNRAGRVKDVQFNETSG